MKSIKYYALIISILVSSFAFGKQEQKSNIYKSGDIAAMVGDSITAGGWYTTNIMLYYATRFPEMSLDFRNIGISGDSCRGILWRMNWDILPQLDKDKAVSVLMIGMNDVHRSKFGKAQREKLGKNLQKKVEETRGRYQENLSKVVDFLADNSRTFIIFTPSIYDQTGDLRDENLFGVNDELIVYGKIGQKLAKEKSNSKTVDMSSAMLAANEKLQKAEGKNKTIIGQDRVHPKFEGGLVMLDKWLTDLNEPKEVSNIEIDAKDKSVKRAFNCDLTNVTFENGKISFDTLEAALPFPVQKQWRNVLKYIDFQKNFNRQTLKVAKLAKGKYALKIDGEKVGEYTDEELAKGVNLAENESTPQYKQALKVSKACLEFRQIAERHRSMYMVELFNRGKMDKLKTVDEKIEFVKELVKKQEGWIAGVSKNYIKNKKREAEIVADAKKKNEEIYKLAKPVTHKFELEKI